MLNFKKSFLGKLPWPFLGAVVIVILINVILAHNNYFKSFLYRYSLLDSAGRAYQYNYILENINQDEQKVVLLGNSLVRQGFDEYDLSKKSKKYIFYNLGISGGRPLDYYMQSDQIIKKNPRIIVLGVSPGNFYSQYSYPKLKYYYTDQFLSLIKYDINLEQILEQRDYFFDSYLSKILFFYKYRELIRSVLRPQNIETEFRNPKTEPNRYSPADNRSLQRSNEIINKNLKKYRHDKLYNIIDYTPFQKDIFIQTIQKFHQNKIKLIIIDMPKREEEQLISEKGVVQDMKDFLTKTSKELNYDYIALKDEPDFNKTDFYDIHHLNKKGRTKLTNFLYDYLVDNQYFAN